MRVLHIGKYYPPVFGGIENVNFELVEGLNHYGIKCDVLCSSDINKSSVETERGYKVFRERCFGKFASTPISLGVITKFMRISSNYDVISVHLPNPLACLALFFCKPNHKIVLHWHSDIIKQKYLLKLFSPIQNYAIKRADLILGATDAHITGSDCYELFKEKSAISPYIFERRNFTSRVDSKLFQELKSQYSGKKIVFSLGRLVYYKGFENLIVSAKSLDDDVMVLIAGVGELKSDLEALIIREGLSEKVKLLGAISHSNLPTFYKFADVFCLPSIHRSEMFGIVQLEAMAFGKPVVSTKLKRSGVPLVNIDGKTGLTVEPGDHASLSKALTKILSDSDLYSILSENALQHVTTFDRELVISQLANYYNKLLEKDINAIK